MASPDQHAQDPYLDPGTGLLRNKAGLTDRDALLAAETELSELRALQLVEDPLPIHGDLSDLQAIHQHLFQDIYEWAGQLRTVDLEKAGEHFMDRYHLERAAQYVFGQLRDDSFLRGMEPDRFADRLAHHYDQVNHLHPFREGNGRSQRVFWTQVAHGAGYELNWSAVTGSTNDQASHIARVDGELGPLRDMFAQIASLHEHGGRPRPRTDMRAVQEKIADLRLAQKHTHRADADSPRSHEWRPDRGRQP